MNPPHQQPQPQSYYTPLQSRGFQPPSQKSRPFQQAPYPQTSQSHVPAFSQQFQTHYNHQQQRPVQYYQQQQPQQYAPVQQQRFTPQQRASPVHPHPTSHASQPYHSHQVHTPSYSYAPTPTYPQPGPGPVVPPPRANSQSPDKAKRPLPHPAAASRSGGSRPTSIPPTSLRGYGTHIQPQQPLHSAHAVPHARPHVPISSFSSPPPSQSISQLLPFQTQVQPPSTPPRQPHPPIPQSHSSSLNRTQTIPSIPLVESPTSKRPLPAPPGAIVSSQPVVSGYPAASASTPNQQRTLPFSPTKAPSVEVGISSRRSAIPSPTRSSTLPASATSSPGISFTNDARGIKPLDEQSPKFANGFTASQVVPSAPLARRSPEPTPPPSFSRPPQKKPAQSLAFRLASLSLQEEQTQKQSATRAPLAPTRSSFSSSPRPPSAHSPALTAIDLDDAPPTSSIRRLSGDSSSKLARTVLPKPEVPVIHLPGEKEDEDEDTDTDIELPTGTASSTSASVAPSINVFEAPAIDISEAPSITVSEAPTESNSQTPSITISEPTPSISVSELPAISASTSSSSIPDIIVADLEGTLETSVGASAQRRKGLICYGCEKGIIGRIVSAMGGRWHPTCFKCSVCSELLEHVSSYEHDGKPYCHLDYHEKFAPQCYHCRTPIVDERFITLDDPGLGKRTYHEQHFFCAECGDPFLAPTIPRKESEATPDLELATQEDDVGFTVYKGHPYCESCHVRLRYPKCKRCKKSIRDGMQAIEALGAKWCWECFLCAGCEKPFDDPAFFQRDNKPYCEPCFSLIIKSEM